MIEYHPEEVRLGKIYDSQIIRRLWGYLSRYRQWLGLSLVFTLVITGIDLCLPYLMKVAIDRYIVVHGRIFELAQPQEGFIHLEGNRYFAPARLLERMDPRVLHRWEEEGRSSERCYWLDLKSLPRARRDMVEGLISQPGKGFERFGDLVIIPYSKLRRLSSAELYTLRGHDLLGVIRITLLFIGLLVISFGLGFGQEWLVELTGQRFMHDLRRQVFSHLQRLPLKFFDRNPVGRLVTRATNDVEAINEMFTEVLFHLVRDGFLLIGVVVVMLRLNYRLALVSFLVLPPLIGATCYFRIKARDVYRAIRVKLAKLNASLQENLSGMRLVQIFSREREQNRRFEGVNREYLCSNLREVKLYATFYPVMELLTSLAVALIIYYGGGQVLIDRISLGMLAAFLSYIQMFFRPVRILAELYTLIQSAMAASERIFLLLDEPITIKSPPEPKRIERVRGSVQFNQVWFSYNERDWVLKGVSFRVEPGEKVALVGATGAGKTSIINLLARLYEPQKGEIRLDGVDIRELDLDFLRSQLGVVMQDLFLFAGDIRYNIRLNRGLSDERVEEVARYVNAERFIERLPNRYSEPVGERGSALSVGERQLLSFARALAADPKILILDEATAAIDAETERLIQDGLRKLLANRTSIVIAHRLSTIKQVDRIYVVHHGEIKETGTHEELLKKRGIYYRLYLMQYQLAA